MTIKTGQSRQDNPDRAIKTGESTQDNPDTHATLGTRHRTKHNTKN